MSSFRDEFDTPEGYADALFEQVVNGNYKHVAEALIESVGTTDNLLVASHLLGRLGAEEPDKKDRLLRVMDEVI